MAGAGAAEPLMNKIFPMLSAVQVALVVAEMAVEMIAVTIIIQRQHQGKPIPAEGVAALQIGLMLLQAAQVDLE